MSFRFSDHYLLFYMKACICQCTSPRGLQTDPAHHHHQLHHRLHGARAGAPQVTVICMLVIIIVKVTLSNVFFYMSRKTVRNHMIGFPF